MSRQLTIFSPFATFGAALAEEEMIRARMALACSIALFVFVATLVALPEIGFLRLVYRLRGASAGELRRMASRRVSHWGSFLVRIIFRIMHIQWTISLPDADTACPAIIIANHTGTIDVIAVFAATSVAGRDDVRWVIKREMLSFPVIGTLARWVGCVPVARNRDPKDRERIRDAGRMVANEAASPFIFPEGTRFDSSKMSEGYLHVLPPKRGGFDSLRDALPDYPVLDITFIWTPLLRGSEGRTIWSALDLYHRALHIDMRLVRPEALDARWLEGAFRRKDQAILRATL